MAIPNLRTTSVECALIQGRDAKFGPVLSYLSSISTLNAAQFLEIFSDSDLIEGVPPALKILMAKFVLDHVGPLREALRAQDAAADPEDAEAEYTTDEMEESRARDREPDVQKTILRFCDHAYVTSGLQNGSVLEPRAASFARAFVDVCSPQQERAFYSHPWPLRRKEQDVMLVAYDGNSLYDCDAKHLRSVVDAVLAKGVVAPGGLYFSLRNNRFYLHGKALNIMASLLEDKRVGGIDLADNPCVGIKEEFAALRSQLALAHYRKLLWIKTPADLAQTGQGSWRDVLDESRKSISPKDLERTVAEAHAKYFSIRE